MKFLKNFFLNQSITNIVFFGLFIRLLFLIVYGSPDFGDTQTHKQIGEEIFSGQLVLSSIHMPGYGIYMYINNFLIKSEYGTIFVDILLSSFSIYFIYLISKKIFKDETVSKISAIIFALYPFSIFFSVSNLNETLYVFLLLLSILNFYNKKYLYGIIFIILSIYVKSLSFFIGPILLLIFLILSKKKFKEILSFFCIYFLVLSIFLSPWWIHNFKKYDAFVPTNLAFGYHLYSGNNLINESGGGIGGVDVDHSLILDNYKHDYFKSDKIFKEKAYEFILNNPKQFINITFKKFKRFWRLYPYAKEYNKIYYKFISITSFGFIFLLSLIFIIFHSKIFLRSITPLLVTIFLFTFVYSITIVSIRYRFPIEPILIILSSYSLRKVTSKN